jgi:anti-sigma B factor antagonist
MLLHAPTRRPDAPALGLQNGPLPWFVLPCLPIVSALDHQKADFDHTKRGEISLLTVRGVLDITNAVDVKSEVAAIEEAGIKKVLVDLGALRQIDSSGVGVLISLFKRVRYGGGQVCFVGITGQPKEVLKILRMDRALDMCATVDEALLKLGGA